MRLAAREIAHQTRQIRDLESHRRRPRRGLLVPPEIPEGMRDGVLGLDRRVELFHPVHGETILDGEPANRIELPLVLERLFGGGLKFLARAVAGRAEILLGGPDFFQHARDEPAPHLGRRPQRAELLLDRVAHLAQCGGARDRRGDQAGQEQGQPDQDAQADRVEPAPHQCAVSVTSRPFRTMPMTTVLPAASPLPSNAIVPVAPSYGGWPRPTRAR